MRKEIENANDRKFAHVINKTTILCDFRKSRAHDTTVSGMVRGIALRHFFKTSEPVVKEGDGHTFYGNMINVYHIRSVKRGIWIASSVRDMSPEETRPIAKAYLASQ